MAALEPSFVVSPTRSSNSTAAFGGVIELSQLLIGTDEDAGPVLCTACRTINRASAKVCKGCDGKLPAFYASAGDLNGAAPPSGNPVPTSAEPAPIPRVRALMNRLEPRLAPWSTVLWAGAVLIAFYAVFGLWYVAHSGSTRPPSRQQAALKAAPTPAAPVAEPNPARTIDALSITLHEAAPERPAMTPVRAAPSAARPPAQSARSEPIDKLPTASSEARPHALRARSGNPLAACHGLNAFARAVCMNNSCAQRGSAGHPQCVQVVQQRRMDEARRNPTLIN